MQYKIEGTAKRADGSVPFGTNIYALNRDTISMESSTTPDIDGNWELVLADSNPKIVLSTFHPSENSNAKVYDMVIPELVSTGYEIYKVGTPGQLGFGVGCLPEVPTGFSMFPGTLDIYSDDFGNYRYNFDGSIMVWIPAFWYKWGTGTNGLGLNEVSIKNFDEYEDEAGANADGFAIHRAFYDDGEIKPGFFIDKYHCSNNTDKECVSSHKYKPPISTSLQSGEAIDTVKPSLGAERNYGGCITMAKSRGSDFFCASRFMFAAIAMLSYAHGKASTNTINCGWYHGTFNYPKGNRNNSRTDVHDSTVVYQPGNYNYQALTGTGGQFNFVIFKKTTHNGQNNGVADISGNMWCVSPGVNRFSNIWRVLPKSFAMKNLTTANCDIVGTYDTTGAGNGNFAASAAYYAIQSNVQTFSEATSGDQWAFTGSGIPTMPGSLAAVEDWNYGGQIYNHNSNNRCLLSCGAGGAGVSSGVWACNLNNAFSSSNNSVGLRLGVYP